MTRARVHLVVLTATLLSAVGSPVRGTLEDLYGDTGDRFQAAIGLAVLEGTVQNQATPGYGLAIDDMVIEWKELTQAPDSTDCEVADGQCATVEVQSGNLFEGIAVVSISAMEPTPYGADGVNDCLLDGDFTDTGYCANTVPMSEGGILFYPNIHTCSVASSTLECGACSTGSTNAGDPCREDAVCLGGTCADAVGCIAHSRYADDTDCDDDGMADIVVLALSEAEPSGEVVILAATGSNGYLGEVPVSTLINSPGALYLAPVGLEQPTVRVRYEDLDDGTGVRCPNSVIPEQRGLIESSATVFFDSCHIAVLGTNLVDNGDGDAFADTDETVELEIALVNNCQTTLTDCFARLSTNSPAIECIRVPVVHVGDLDDTENPQPVSEPFVFKVGPVSRSNTDDVFTAEFNVSLTCNEIASIAIQQQISLELDLTLSDLGQAPVTWFEGFESGSMGRFEPMNVDAGIAGSSDPEGVANADGWRCQYNDPDWINGSSYGNDAALVCFPTNSLAQSNEVYFHADGPGGTGGNNVDAGRAFSGSFSMAYNLPAVGYAGWTTPVSTIDAAQTTAPINLGVGSPELSLWHQVSLLDGRALGTIPIGRSADRGKVQIQITSGADSPAERGDWLNLEPFQNSYDSQAVDNYFGCMFDPVDDGTTEDDFLDPTDPDRDDGPSSTCYPEFTYACMGDTTAAAFPGPICNATTPPDPFDDVPSWGQGTWVEARHDLSQYRGRRARLRFLVTSIKISEDTWEEQFFETPDPRDDGWWIDDVGIDEVLTNPAELQVDDFVIKSCSISGSSCIAQCELDYRDCDSATGSPCTGSGNSCVNPCVAGEGSCTGPAPDCGADCTTVTANVIVEPAGLLNPISVTTPAPGQVVRFDAADPTGPSFADACLSGTLQYRFCLDGDEDASCDDTGDVIERGWTDDPSLSLAPGEGASYTTEVRCSTVPMCIGARRVDIDVGCPGGVNALGLAGLVATSKTALSWSGDSLTVDWLAGPLAKLRVDQPDGPYGGAGFSVAAAAGSIPMSAMPQRGAGDYYLVKQDGPLNTTEGEYFCNSRTWRSSGSFEVPEATPGRDATLGDPTP